MNPPIKYVSASKHDLFFWAERVSDCEPSAFMVVSQVVGFPATEAFDDWFHRQTDAEAVAYKLAQGEEL